MSFKRPFAAFIALIGWAALALQFKLMLGYAGANGQPIVEGIFRYLSFFTVLTNLLAALSLTVTTLAARGNPFTRASVQTAILVYLIIVSLVYAILLQGLYHSGGPQHVANVTLHYVLPTLYFLYWLFFVPKGELRLHDASLWLAYPAMYGACMLWRGAIAGEYPYPFLNAAKLGYAQALLNLVGLGAVFLVLGLIAVWADRKLAKFRG